MATGERKAIRDRAEKTLRHRWEQLRFDALLAPEQQYIAIYWLVGDVMNGSFHQYFFNSSGDLAPLALEGLKADGAAASLRVLERALALFPPGGCSTDRATRWEGLRAISDDVDAEILAFRELSDALRDCPEDFEGLALDRLAALYSGNGVWDEPPAAAEELRGQGAP